MKTILKFAGIMIGCALAGMAQPQSSSTSYMGQTWVGILTSAECGASDSAAGSKGKSESERAAELTTTDRVTTPAVDASGTRGSATGNDPAGHDTLPRTGDIHSREKEKVKDSGWAAAKKQAAGLGANCPVTGTTRQFSLVLPDGRSVLFDEVANTAIVKQLQQREGGLDKPLLLRVKVAGKLQKGQIALDSIRM